MGGGDAYSADFFQIIMHFSPITYNLMDLFGGLRILGYWERSIYR